MLPGLRKADGSLLVTAVAPSANARFNGGIAVEPNGAVCTTTTVSTNFVNGFMVSPTGQLVTGAGPIVTSDQGYPRNAAGALFTQLNQTPAATDPFVGGIRVGPLGGVYVTDVP